MHSLLERPKSRPSALLADGPSDPEQFRFLEEPRWLPYAIRRHRATKLHTDFRFQACGWLLSWATDAKPTLDPRRTVELQEMPDHDPRFLVGERRIPDGQYGAGPTLVTDYGRYRPLVIGLDDPERALVAALQYGRLDVFLEGVVLRGLFRFERTDEGWNFRKLQDRFATPVPLKWPDVSIRSGKGFDEIEAEYQTSLVA